MSVWHEVFLGVIAAAALCMALVQVGLVVLAIRLGRRVSRLADQVENELKPLLANLNSMGREASRAVALAALQVERADKLFADVAGKIDWALSALQGGLMGPALRGRALAAAVRAALAAIRQARPRTGRSDDEDALFI